MRTLIFPRELNFIMRMWLGNLKPGLQKLNGVRFLSQALSYKELFETERTGRNQDERMIQLNFSSRINVYKKIRIYLFMALGLTQPLTEMSKR
jgi:hypothetical protein